MWTSHDCVKHNAPQILHFTKTVRLDLYTACASIYTLPFDVSMTYRLHEYIISTRSQRAVLDPLEPLARAHNIRPRSKLCWDGGYNSSSAACWVLSSAASSTGLVSYSIVESNQKSVICSPGVTAAELLDAAAAELLDAVSAGGLDAAVAAPLGASAAALLYVCASYNCCTAALLYVCAAYTCCTAALLYEWECSVASFWYSFVCQM